MYTKKCLLGIVVLGILALCTAQANAVESSWFNILDFGATPNDETPDSQAIQKAIDAAADAGGGTIYLPRGVYLIDKPIDIQDNNLVLTGDGSSTILKNQQAEDALIRSLSCTRSPTTSLEHVIIEKMHLDGADKSVDGIMFTGMTRGCVVRDIVVTKCLNGIDLSGCWSMSLERNHITGCSEAGISLGVFAGDKRRKHRNASIANAISVIGNTVTGCATGIIWSGGNGWIMSGNTFERNMRNADILNTESGTIIGNYFEASQSKDALMVLGRKDSGIPKNLFIAGNMFYDDKVAGIQINALINSQIIGNRMAVPAERFVEIAKSSFPHRIRGNEIQTQNHNASRCPESGDSYGVPGQIAYGSNYMYICISPNKWKRVPLEDWPKTKK
jgi:hypothetical protein